MSVAAVLLAAGASRRLGRPKQLVDLAGEAMVRRAARLCLQAGLAPVLVVVGCAADEVAAALEGLGVSVVPNPDWPEGMAASLRAGVAALPPDCPAVLLLPCDQPALSADLLAALAAAHEADRSATVASAYGGGLGVPALFPRARFPEFTALRGDRGAKALLAGAVAVPFPGGEVDLDTPEDLEALLRR